MRKYNFFISKNREFVTFFLIILSNFILVYLFNIDIRIFMSILLVDTLIMIYYILISLNNHRKENNYEEKIESLENELRNSNENYFTYKNDLKDYFLIWIHQIKTPITSLKLLSESLDNKDKEKLKILSISIENYTEMALSYLKLVDFSVDMNVKKVEISDIVKKIIKKYRVHFISTNTKLHYKEFQKETVSDENYLEIMIEQIINNALKYASGSDIFIGFRDDYLYIKDTGFGIRQDEIKMIFNKGYSAKNYINPNKSTGIGLYIVKRISEKLNHKVEVYSTIGKYTEFRIYFLEN